VAAYIESVWVLGMEDTVVIEFERQAENGSIFRDAIHLPADHTLSVDDIESIKEQRFLAWLGVVEQFRIQSEASPEVVPTPGAQS
jgi:hypothetical protein